MDNDLKNICNYKVKKCLKCHSNTNPTDAKELFCSNCGAPVLNRCSNYECLEILDENAKHCKYCGSSSLFKNYGFFEVTPPINNDLPF